MLTKTNSLYKFSAGGVFGASEVAAQFKEENGIIIVYSESSFSNFDTNFNSPGSLYKLFQITWKNMALQNQN